jgi:hypothetical protein
MQSSTRFPLPTKNIENNPMQSSLAWAELIRSLNYGHNFGDRISVTVHLIAGISVTVHLIAGGSRWRGFSGFAVRAAFGKSS